MVGPRHLCHWLVEHEGVTVECLPVDSYGRVLLATGTDPELARGTLRFSLGRTSTEADVEAVAKAIAPAVERARAAGLT